MEPINVTVKETNRITQEQQNYIKELKTHFLEKYKDVKTEENKLVEYESLIKKLESIHINLKTDILLPVVKDSKDFPMCFIDAHVYHTNEVYVPIGSSYYKKESTTDAIKSCHRKMDVIKENIIQLEDEKKTFLEKIVFIEESLLQPGQVEIIEEYPEDYEIPGSRRNKKRNATEPSTSKQ